VSLSILTAGKEEYFRNALKELLRWSEKEFATWKRTRNVVFLRHACEKAFVAVEWVTSIKAQQELDTDKDLKKVFKKKFPGKKHKNVMRKAIDLREFFHGGLQMQPNTKKIEKEYVEVIKFIRSVKL